MPGTDLETELIAVLREAMPCRRDDVRLGIGDDAAILRPPPGRDLAVATDTLVAGVHFPAGTPAADVGWKALAVNLSDLAAMGAAPAWALLSLTLPGGDRDWVRDFADGMASLAAEFEVGLVGGDTTRGPLSVTVQATGFLEAGRGMRRDGARAGHGIFVTGNLGDAAAGLAIAESRLDAGDAGPVLRRRLDRPAPRVKAGLALGGLAGACIDLSDGLTTDLGRILAASGAGARVALDALPASDPLLAAVPDATARAALQVAGDDYELCFTAPPAHAGALQGLSKELDLPITRIGEIVDGQGVSFTRGGAPSPPPGAGWRHFGDGDA